MKLFSLFSEACAQMKRLYWNHILTINNFNNGTFKNLFLLIVLSKIRKYIFAYAYLYILGMCFIHNIEVYTYKVMVTVIIIMIQRQPTCTPLLWISHDIIQDILNAVIYEAHLQDNYECSHFKGNI